MNPAQAPLTYSSYLKIDPLLNLQELQSEAITGEPVHDEMLFILIHQAYELWFKQMLHDVESVRKLLAADHLPETALGTVVSRLERTRLILDLLIEQVRVIESMTALDFLDFRGFLGSASGFQSFQFRVLELTLGLPADQRIGYGTTTYREALPETERKLIENLLQNPTLFDCVERWLDRTPFLQQGSFDFAEKYRETLAQLYQEEEDKVKNWPNLSEGERTGRMALIASNRDYALGLLDPEKHAELLKSGQIRLGWRALVAALLINVYREQPILQQPFHLLHLLVEIDDRLCTWRFRHAQMVLKMLGKKVGTGGSSGYDYLMKTVEAHHIFRDFAVVSTLLVPRNRLPELPDDVRKSLDFVFANQ